MGDYARRSEAALASFMEKFQLVAWSSKRRGGEAQPVSRSSGKRGLPDVDDGRLADTPTNVDRVRIVAAAERLHVESDGDRKPQPGRPMTLVKSGPPLETVPGALSEPSTLKVGSKGRLRKIRGSSN
jgi:hypothetical protein